jgi:23S rRNA (uracil1939-C5)-methyltransferase
VPPVELRTTAVAAGGEAVARDDDGRVVFVTGALPGERVAVELTEAKARFARGHVVELLDASPDRSAPPCPHVGRGCGGCTWQHVEVAAQRRLKVEIVRDSLVRLGQVVDPLVEPGPELPSIGYRTTIRMAVVDGRAGFRRARSHDVVGVDDCLVAHPLLDELVGTGRFGAATEVTLRCGARPGDRLVVADPSAEGVELPDGVTVVGEDELAAGHRAWFHEEVAGRRLRVSARSFFQARPDGADALVAAVRDAIAGAPEGRLVDAYGGVGLFGATVGQGRPVTLVEWSASSVADARVNLPEAKVLRLDVARWHPAQAAVVVADPARTGLGKAAVEALAGTGAGHLALVSCDPASLGRDAGLLARHGFTHAGTTLVDLFPHTPHVEAVTRFIREPGQRRTTSR